jgi:hypothetical protein
MAMCAASPPVSKAGQSWPEDLRLAVPLADVWALLPLQSTINLLTRNFTL